MDEKLLNLLQEKPFVLPALFFKSYKQLGLTDEEFLLVLHIHQLSEEGVTFPSPEMLAGRMTADENNISSILRQLLRKGLIEIKEQPRSSTAMIQEEMTLQPLYRKMAESAGQPSEADGREQSEIEEGRLFQRFEEEFGRPLSSIEMEMISMWLDEDKHTCELIQSALKEAVISSKLNFRYIDRILFEWKRKGIKTPEQARQMTEEVRNQRKGTQAPPVKAARPHPGYNWLEGGKS
ncbi:DnaD domain-containing protein [Alkalicoccus luteus]|uniref:DnaD domain-containing protein n=1 Tax=Alkalicoccus luteus TaxID=1237094 RepID=A0A969PWR5_9BACI|nr:DnaD domain-containing protein [Alkalicoccus luteus]NJP38899.1 DnaD domain-containing protein [Alkalicoccus luteus]